MTEDEEVERLMTALGIAVTPSMRAPDLGQFRGVLAERAASLIRQPEVAAVTVDVAAGAVTYTTTPTPHVDQARLAKAFFDRN